ncbi:winged helix-turn-helix domain-containing tetratricopeptide repeat protein [Novosphingobium lentum]|uniref:winged helix-turn-helix domain-containing tetratricopeptide repeat protein n=1 Tax=Novosphingobium lentum TaxID=145287 RepID=UPI000836B7CA|nr:winged helix-turn-helix domain-containing protein [Novosphingobium lentum]
MKVVSDSKVRFDRFVLDREDERLIGPQGPIRIGNKAFRVLDALIEQDGKLLTKEALFESVWDGTFVSESALTSVIKELRRALGDEPKNSRVIQSVYGRGYRLVAPIETADGNGDWSQTGSGRWQVVAERPLSPVSKAVPTLRLPDRPSIAVLPFIERGAGDEPWFADAVVEEIVVALSRFRTLFVISSATSLSYRDRTADPATVSAELGVRYILSGTVQRDSGRVRFIIRLDDGIDGGTVWTEKFSDTMDDIFDLQDRIALAVAGRIGSSINDAEASRYGRKSTPSPSVREYYWRANLAIRRIAPDSIAESLELANRALEIEPDNTWALSLASVSHAFQYLLGWSDDRALSRAKALQLYEQAIQSHGDDERVLGFCGAALNCIGHDPDTAMQLTDRAIELNPCNTTSLFWGAWSDVVQGNPGRALARAEDSVRLNPLSAIRHLTSIPLAIAMILLGRSEEAVEQLRVVVEISPQPDALAALAIALVQVGRLDDARAVHARLTAAGGAIGGLALMRTPEHIRLVKESLAAAAG